MTLAAVWLGRRHACVHVPPVSTVMTCLVSCGRCSVRPREANAAGLAVDGGVGERSAGPPSPTPAPSCEHSPIPTPPHCCLPSRLCLGERVTCLGHCSVRECSFWKVFLPMRDLQEEAVGSLPADGTGRHSVTPGTVAAAVPP